MLDLAFGVSMPHTSVPALQPLRPDSDGTAHLVIVARPGVTPAELRRLTASPTCTVLSPPDVASAERQLEQQLAAARVGLRVYLVGPEAFARRLEAAALSAGLLPSEIRAQVVGDEVRVWCTHCKAITEARACNLVPCRGCGRQLVLYHHFSRRHAAYMGFQADAELPGELPRREEGLPWA